MTTAFELRLHGFSLFGLLPLGQVYSLLNLALLVLTLLLDHVVSLRMLLLLLDVHLQIYYFLQNWSIHKLTFYSFSSLRFLMSVISLALFLVSSIFFQVFISSCLSKAMRFANSCASFSSLYGLIILGVTLFFFFSYHLEIHLGYLHVLKCFHHHGKPFFIVVVHLRHLHQCCLTVIVLPYFYFNLNK
jgi:hypothetical protein